MYVCIYIYTSPLPCAEALARWWEWAVPLARIQLDVWGADTTVRGLCLTLLVALVTCLVWFLPCAEALARWWEWAVPLARTRLFRREISRSSSINSSIDLPRMFPSVCRSAREVVGVGGTSSQDSTRRLGRGHHSARLLSQALRASIRRFAASAYALRRGANPLCGLRVSLVGALFVVAVACAGRGGSVVEARRRTRS